jgi:hypothetical protein
MMSIVSGHSLRDKLVNNILFVRLKKVINNFTFMRGKDFLDHVSVSLFFLCFLPGHTHF